MKTIVKIINTIEDALYKVFVVFSKGFFFYLSLLVGLLHKVFPLSIFENLKLYFNKKQNDAAAFLAIVVVFLVGINIYIHFYDGNSIAHVSSNTINNKLVETQVGVLDEKELNLYRRYSKLDINSVSMQELRKTNENVVSWLTVDGTNINYPVVKGNDNDYYLNHDINGDLKFSGWVFMDYRNASDLGDSNNIFYGHNLANKTAFGSLENVFKDDWFKNSNHYIVILNDYGKSVYEIFSAYTIEPELYYLQINFNNQDDFYEFAKTLKNRSVHDFGVDVKKNDKIITLSTCTSDNKNRNVVHAKLIN